MRVVREDNAGYSSFITQREMLDIYLFQLLLARGNIFHETVCVYLSLYLFLSMCTRRYICLSLCLSACVCLSLSVCLLTCLFVCLSFCLSVCLTDWLTDCLSVYFYISIYLSIYLYISIYLYLSIFLSVCIYSFRCLVVGYSAMNCLISVRVQAWPDDGELHAVHPFVRVVDK